MAAPRVRPSVAILGCGNVGCTLGWELAKCWKRARIRGDLWLWSRRSKSVVALLEQLEPYPVRARALQQPEDVLRASKVVLLCLPDAAIVSLANRLARAIPPRGKALPVVLHTNGLLGADALRPLKRRGVPVGKLHPFAAMNDATSILQDRSFGIEGDPRALEAARTITRWVGGRPILLGMGSGPVYHASASLLSGGIVALFELADQLLSRAVPMQSSRRRALVELGDSTLTNIHFDGARRALTGAIARGAEGTVRGHLRVLRRNPEALAAYQILGRTMLELARARRSIDADAYRQIARLIRTPARRR